MRVRQRIWPATLLGIGLGVALIADPYPATSASDPANAASASAPSVGTTETVSEQAEDVSAIFDGSGLPAHVVVGWGGHVTAVWYRPSATSVRSGRLYASVRGTGGVWSTPLRVSQRISLHLPYDVAAGAESVVSVVWSARVNGTQRVFESHRDGAGWSPRIRLGKGTDPRVVVDGRGRTTVMWISHRKPHLATRTPAGVWSDTRVFRTRGFVFTSALATNRAGDVVALWGEGNSHGHRTRASWKGHSSRTWRSATTVSTRVVAEDGLELGMDRKGRVLAIWQAASDLGDGHVWWTHRSLAGRWSPVQAIAGNIGHLDEFVNGGLSVNSHGRALAWWDGEGSFAARYRPGHGFGAASRVNGIDAEGSPLLTPDGTAVIAGLRSANGQQRVAYRRQNRGQPWSRIQGLDPAEAMNAVGSRGRRMVILFQAQGLRARVINLR
jgi:hypothetical protein